jgi:uncharacterized protein
VSTSRAGVYVDTCLLVSLFHNDSGYPAAVAWLAGAATQELWISHWVLLEFASATAVRQRRGELGSTKVSSLQSELEAFRAERLALLEPRAEDFLLARVWVQRQSAPGLRAGDALHLAVAHRQRLTLVSADQALVVAARQFDTKAQLVG